MTARRIATDDKHYNHVQNSPSTTWVVVHNLGKIPSVSVRDSAGSEVTMSVVHNSINQCTLTSTAAFSGQASCN